MGMLTPKNATKRASKTRSTSHATNTIPNARVQLVSNDALYTANHAIRAKPRPNRSAVAPRLAPRKNTTRRGR